MKRRRFTGNPDDEFANTPQFVSKLPECHFGTPIYNGTSESTRSFCEGPIVSLVQVDLGTNFRRVEFSPSEENMLVAFIEKLGKVFGGKVSGLYALLSAGSQLIPVAVENDQQLSAFFSKGKAVTDRLFRVSLASSGSYFS